MGLGASDLAWTALGPNWVGKDPKSAETVPNRAGTGAHGALSADGIRSGDVWATLLLCVYVGEI